MSSLFEDVRHALRVYRASAFGATFAVLALATAMACVTASFALLSDLVLDSHEGFSPSGRVVSLGVTNGSRFEALSLNLVERIDAEAGSLQSVIGTHERVLSWDREGQSFDVGAELVTRRYFSELQPNLRIGRGLEDADHRADAAPVAVISHRFWQRHFAGSVDAVGRTLRIGGVPSAVMVGPDGRPEAAIEHWAEYRIVGVLAPALIGTFATTTDVWLPYEQAGPYLVGPAQRFRMRTALNALAVLRPSLAPEAAIGELSSRYVGPNEMLSLDAGARVGYLSGFARDIGSQRAARRQVRMLVAGCVLLVVVAASNVSLFLFSLAPRRERELGIRMAVGARAGRLAKQLATEAGVLVMIAAALGLSSSAPLARFLQGQPLLRAGEWRAVSPFDWQVLTMVVGAALFVTALVSVAPILRVQRLDIGRTSRMVAARAGPGQRVAGAAQVSIATVLIGVSVALIWQLLSQANTDHGFEPTNVHLIELQPQDPTGVFTVTPEEILAARQHRRSAIGGLPGIEAVTFASAVPGRVAQFSASIPKPGASDGDAVRATVVSADTGYTELLGMTMLYGNPLTAADTDGVLVNRTLARRLWGRDDVVGEPLTTARRQLRVAGVLKDASFGHPAEAVQPMMFALVERASFRDAIVVRSPESAEEIRRLLQRQVDEGALNVDLLSVRPLDEVWGALLEPDRARAFLAMSAASLVMLLAAFGFYGTLRFLVNAGRREYAIRSAMGARPPAIRQLAMQRGLAMGIPGLISGALLTFVIVAWMCDELALTAVSPFSTVVIALLPMSLMLYGSALGPANHAARTAPAPLLREE